MESGSNENHNFDKQIPEEISVPPEFRRKTPQEIAHDVQSLVYMNTVLSQAQTIWDSDADWRQKREHAHVALGVKYAVLREKPGSSSDSPGFIIEEFDSWEGVVRAGCGDNVVGKPKEMFQRVLEYASTQLSPKESGQYMSELMRMVSELAAERMRGQSADPHDSSRVKDFHGNKTVADVYTALMLTGGNIPRRGEYLSGTDMEAEAEELGEPVFEALCQQYGTYQHLAKKLLGEERPMPLTNLRDITDSSPFRRSDYSFNEETELGEPERMSNLLAAMAEMAAAQRAIYAYRLLKTQPHALIPKKVLTDTIQQFEDIRQGAISDEARLTMDNVSQELRKHKAGVDFILEREAQQKQMEESALTFAKRRIKEISAESGKQTVEIGGKTKQEILRSIADSGVQMDARVEQMIKSSDFTVSPTVQKVRTIVLQVRDLGFSTKGVTLDQLYRRVRALGLRVCPAELGPLYRLQYTDQDPGDTLNIGMEPDGADRSFVFRLACGPTQYTDRILELDGYTVSLYDDAFSPLSKFAFLTAD